jgi:hypothetical protein
MVSYSSHCEWFYFGAAVRLHQNVHLTDLGLPYPDNRFIPGQPSSFYVGGCRDLPGPGPLSLQEQVLFQRVLAGE